MKDNILKKIKIAKSFRMFLIILVLISALLENTRIKV